MEKQFADKIIESYVKKLYGFAVSKSNSPSEAEELSEKIILEVYKTLLAREDIANIDGYIYKVAHNVYVRHVSREAALRRVDGIEHISDERDIFDEVSAYEEIGTLRREITYLSAIQRQIIILHYYKNKRVREIAETLDISEGTVKWHLSCARKELRSNMEKVRTTGALGVEPIEFMSMGHSGHAGEKGDTADFLAKRITQNIAYAAYHTPRTVGEIAAELGINPIFAADEVSVLEEYGFMDKLPGDKYRTNIMIIIPDKEIDRKMFEMNKEYAAKFAEGFVRPILDSITEIPDYVIVPDNDLELYKWSLVDFICYKLATAEIDDMKFSVKRKDGGDFVAHAVLRPKEDSGDGSAHHNGGYYSFCGDMWRDSGYDENGFSARGAKLRWLSWQLDCYWTDREGTWRNNLDTDYRGLYYYLNGELPENEANAHIYARLLDKGYLIRTENGFKVNIIICKSYGKWFDPIPDAPENITALSKEYAAKTAELEIKNQPEHMHSLIKYYAQNSACALHTYIMAYLVENGVLKKPAPEQSKGLLTVLFTGQ